MRNSDGGMDLQGATCEGVRSSGCILNARFTGFAVDQMDQIWDVGAMEEIGGLQDCWPEPMEGCSHH